MMTTTKRHSVFIADFKTQGSVVVIDASRDPIAPRRFDNFVREANIFIEPVAVIQAQIARDAYRDFGRGSGHPAKLNFGDCFAYVCGYHRKLSRRRIY